MAGDLREPRPAAASRAAAWQDVLEELERSLRDATRAIIRLRQTLEEGDEPPEPGRERPVWSPVLANREPQTAAPIRPALEPVRRNDEPQTAAPGASAFEPVAPSDLSAPRRLEGQDEAPEEPREDTTALPAELGTRLAAFERARRDLSQQRSAEEQDATADDSRDEDDGDLGLSPEERSARLSTFERVWERIEREKKEQGLEEPPEPSKERRGLDLMPEQGVEDSPEPSKERHGLDLLPQQYLITVEDKESRVDLAPLHRALMTMAKQDDIALVSFANGVPVISVRTESELDTDQLKEAVAAATNRRCEVIPQEGGRIFLRLAPVEEER